MAFIDSLTNINNRRFFETQLSDIIASSDKSKEEFCLVFIDIDNLKNINDTKGHDVGDEILILLTNTFKESLREGDTIARWGGEEIVILLPHTDIKTGEILANKLKLLLENNILIQEILSYNLTASFGITAFASGDNKYTIVQRADEAMYISKNSGKNRVSIL